MRTYAGARAMTGRLLLFTPSNCIRPRLVPAVFGQAKFLVSGITGNLVARNCVAATQFPMKNHRSNYSMGPHFLGNIVVV